MYDLALSCGQAGGILPAVLNAASEVAVGAFLVGRIGYCDIWQVSDAVVQGVSNCPAQSYEQLAEADRSARAAADIYIKKRYNGT